MKKVLLFCCTLLSSAIVMAQNNADSLLKFVVANKTKSSLFLVENDSVVARLNENKRMPLASTVKIMVAIEFAKQAGAGVIKKEVRVPLAELEKYYLPDTDGGAHPEWLAYERMQQHVTDEQIRLIDIARGMMMFSSNANAEYLMDLLGFNNVKNNIQLLRLQQHTAIYPMVASLFFYQNPRNKKEESILKDIRKLSDEQYSRYAYELHNALKFDTVLKTHFRPQDLSMNMQKLWSDRLPASTTKEYAQIAGVLNSRKFFDTSAYTILSDVMETLMENPANQQWLKHAGMKGGSTAWVLTKTLYATTKNGTQLELAYFFNELTVQQNEKLQTWMNDFELKVLTDSDFRMKIREELR